MAVMGRRRAVAWGVAIVALLLAIAAGRKPNMYDLPTKLCEWDDIGLSGYMSTGSRVVAFGDFNSDKNLDLFVVTGDLQHVNVFIWNAAMYRFDLQSSLSISIVDDKSVSGTITSVVPGDFNYDGHLDVLVQGRYSTDKSYWAKIFTGSISDMTFTEMPQTLKSDEELLVFDYNGDMQLDLFGFAGGVRTVWVNDGKGDFVSRTNISEMIGKANGANPNGRAHASVDLNGDCFADLVVATVDGSGTPVLEVYVWNNGARKFQYSQSVVLAPTSGPVTFADADVDGNIDIIYTMNNGADIATHYNVQMGLCESSSATNCRSSDNLCVADPGFSFVSYDHRSKGNVAVSSLNERALSNARIHVGDINADGVPELLITLASGVVSMFGTSAGSRNGFAPVADPRIQQPIQSIQNAVLGTFFDVNEDGIMDVMVMDQSTAPVKFFINNLNEDTFFFKTLVSNGVCPEWCDDSRWPERFPSPKPYGVSQPGTVVKFIVTDTGGVNRIRCGGQLYQSSYQSLQLPYAFIGLGRTFSYIVQFSVGISAGYIGTWSTMIPNSQLVVFPSPASDPGRWVVELFLLPSSNFLWVFISVLVTSIALAAAIVIMHWRHLKADMLEQRKAEHFFTF
ncbi:ASPIC/UnbV domain-containing protein [Plasmodiophora brassicae]|nr:hypothetical protein PBRA_000149 [Plasmodiophora brassicae]